LVIKKKFVMMHGHMNIKKGIGIVKIEGKVVPEKRRRFLGTLYV